MAVSTLCPSLVQGCALRITELNECGVPLDPLTPFSRIQMAAFVSVTASPNTEDGTEFMLKTACGLIDNYFVDTTRVKRYDLTMTLSRVHIPTLVMLLGADLLAAPDDPAEFIGFVLANDLTKANPDPKMIEIQARNVNASECGVGGASAQNIWVHNWVLTRNWSISGDLSVDDENVFTVELSGQAFNNPNYFPSYPDSDYPSWVPGGGDPDGVPTGPPPPVLPGGMDADPVPLDWQEQIQDGGPYFGYATGPDFYETTGDLACNWVGLGS